MSFFEKRSRLLQDPDGAGQLQFQKAPHSTGEGDRYEEASLALVFLRGVRTGLRFALSSNDAAGGKFDDVVLCWSDQQSPSGSALLVQLKHKTSAKQTTVRRASLMVRKDSKKESKDFSLEVYHESYEKIRDSLEGGNYMLVLSTNLDLDTDAQNMFVPHDPKSIPGLELLDSGGRLYRLKPDDEDVKSLVPDDDRFMQHFYLFCNQSSNRSMREKIYTELKLTLGVDESCCKTMCDDLCSNLREWMNSQNICLTSSWRNWLNIVDTYIKDKVTTCNSVVTRIKYRNVEETLQAHIEGCNPAWIRPPGDEATALTATKVHQMICDEKHIMVSVTRLSELEEKILCCWGPFCRWLIIVDDNDGDKHSYDILDHLRELARPNRRLVIVSDKGDDPFPDTCQSDDILEESWEELLKVKILLNSENYVCHLGDLCNTESLKAILDQNPKALAALSQLSDPVRMGQDLHPLPKNHICRQLTCHLRVNPDFFSSLEEKKVCIMNELSYERLTNKVVMKNKAKFEDLEKYLRVSDPVFPLFVVTRNIDCSAVQMISSKYADVSVYVLSHVDEEWLYVEKQSISLLNVVHSSNDRVIVEGKPGIGKSTMLLDMAQQLKGQHPSWWILRIDLLKYSEVFDSCDSGDKASEDILNAVVYNEKNRGIGLLEHSILQHCLLEYPHIVCMVDGFDEVCPDYAEKCLQALQELAPGRGKLVVATRPSVTGRLEATLGALAYTLPSFSDKQLEEFHNRPLSHMGVTDTVIDLLKIPLFSRMYAEVSKIGHIVEDIVSLYEAFFERKFRILYKEKLGHDLSKPANKNIFHRERMQHEKHLEFLAVSHLLPALEVPGIAQLTSEDRDDLVKAGVIYKFNSDKPVFIHRTFAEHFLAKWCFSKDADSLRADVYRKALSDASLEFFVESFDRMASKDRPLLRAVLNHRKTEVKSLLENGADAAEEDKWGRNSLHLAAAYSRDTTVLGLLVERLGVAGGPAPGPAEVRLGAVAGKAVSEADRKPRNTESAGVASDSQLVEAREGAGPSAVEEMVGTDGPAQYEEVFHAVTAALGAEDGLLRWTPLRYAAERRRWWAVTALLEAGAQLKQLGDFQRGQHSLEELWRIFEEKSGWSSQMLEHRGENHKCLEIKVAVSIVCTDLSAGQYLESSRKLWASDNIEVLKLVDCKMRDMLEKSSGVATSALEQHQDCSGTSQLGECRNMPPDEAGLGSSLFHQMEMACDIVMFRDANGETFVHNEMTM